MSEFGDNPMVRSENTSDWHEFNFICERCGAAQDRYRADDIDHILCNKCNSAYDEDEQKDEYLEAFFKVLKHEVVRA